MTTGPTADQIDVRLLSALARDPRASAIVLAEQAKVSRNTVQARLSKWAQDGMLRSFDRCIDPAFLGYPMRAYIRARLKQRLLGQVSTALGELPEVVEVLGLSGGADLLIQVVARDADDLYRIAGQVLSIRGVRRTNTSLVMRELVDHRATQLLGDAGPQPGPRSHGSVGS
jgi:DNA-binding Lrp family transcriptional regulator